MTARRPPCARVAPRSFRNRTGARRLQGHDYSAYPEGYWEDDEDFDIYSGAGYCDSKEHGLRLDNVFNYDIGRVDSVQACWSACLDAYPSDDEDEYLFCAGWNNVQIGKAARAPARRPI